MPKVRFIRSRKVCCRSRSPANSSRGIRGNEMGTQHPVNRNQAHFPHNIAIGRRCKGDERRFITIGRSRGGCVSAPSRWVYAARRMGRVRRRARYLFCGVHRPVQHAVTAPFPSAVGDPAVEAAFASNPRAAVEVGALWGMSRRRHPGPTGLRAPVGYGRWLCRG
jgi:hypothetical protein